MPKVSLFGKKGRFRRLSSRSAVAFSISRISSTVFALAMVRMTFATSLASTLSSGPGFVACLVNWYRSFALLPRTYSFSAIRTPQARTLPVPRRFQVLRVPDERTAVPADKQHGFPPARCVSAQHQALRVVLLIARRLQLGKQVSRQA